MDQTRRWRVAPTDGRVLLRQNGNRAMKYLLLMLLLTSLPLEVPLAAQESGIAVGSPAPAVTVPDLDGNPVDLARYIGRKPLFLEFWATWCELCEELLPQVRAAQATYGS